MSGHPILGWKTVRPIWHPTTEKGQLCRKPFFHTIFFNLPKSYENCYLHQDFCSFFFLNFAPCPPPRHLSSLRYERIQKTFLGCAAAASNWEAGWYGVQSLFVFYFRGMGWGGGPSRAPPPPRGTTPMGVSFIFSAQSA